MAGDTPRGAATKRKPIASPLGVSGLPRYAGILFDEWLPELQGVRGRKVLREMADNSPQIGALMFSVEMMARRVPWNINKGEDTDQGTKASDLVFTALHDMETSWPDTLADILSMCTYGWSLFEEVFKVRDGKESKYDDGQVGWLGWQMRSQDTLLRWKYADDHANFPEAFVQLGPPDWAEHTIPMDRCLLFRTTTRRSSPEGRSLWRNAYPSYYFVKHLEAIEAIGAERDMAGLPVGKIPSHLFESDLSPEDQQTYQHWSDLVTNVRRDEQEGVLIPSDLWDETEVPMFDLQLLTTGGQRQFNLGDVIRRHQQDILMTCLADFMLLGHGSGGPQSLGKTKIELFTTAVSALLAIICAQVNDVAIPRLLQMNGMSLDNPPKLQHGEIERADLDILGNYIYQLGQAGFVLDTNPHGDLYRHLLEQAHLPVPPVGQMNPFPDNWEDMMPNPPGTPQPLGPGPGQWKGVVQVKQNSQAPVAPSPANQQPQLAGKARPSLRQPNQPNAPKAEPPHVARGPLDANGVIAKRNKAKRASEGLATAARLMSEMADCDLDRVAFDLDNTALLYPQVLAPLANMLADDGVQVGVLTGNDSQAARDMWDTLGYPAPAFFEAHPASDVGTTAQWKAQQCKQLDVDVLIDDFSGGRNAALFTFENDRIGGTTLPLQVVLPANREHQHVQ